MKTPKPPPHTKQDVYLAQDLENRFRSLFFQRGKYHKAGKFAVESF